MKTLLITGFEPFVGETVNPSWEAVKRLPEKIDPWYVEKLRLPTEFGRAAELLLSWAEVLRPALILSVGQAGGRAGVTPEAVAINLREARIPDNAGNQPVNVPVIPGGPAAYFSTAPVRDMVEAIAAAGLPASLSLSAGAFVCNDVLYTVLHHYHGTPVQAAFIHVPFLPEQAPPGRASMPVEDMARALQLAVEACAAARI